MPMKKLKLVTFDVTNTLLKFRVPPWQHYTVIARDHGFQGAEDEVKERLLGSYKIMWNKYPNFGKSTIDWEEWWRSVVKLTFKDQLPATADVNIVANTLIQEYKTSKCWCTAKGATELLDLFQNNGTSIGIISNFDPRLYDVLQSVDINNYFDFVVTSYETGYSKPDARIFKHAIQQCSRKVDPSECLHIGDDLKKDYEGARAAGWHALLVTKSLRTETPPAEYHVFNDLENLSLAIQNEKLKL